MKPNERVYAAGAILMIIGAATFYSCEESEASVKPEPKCCDVREQTLAYADSFGNGVVVGQVGHTLAYAPGAVIGDEAELAAEIGSRCMETVKRTLKRHPEDYWIVVCIDPEIPIGTEVAPTPED